MKALELSDRLPGAQVRSVVEWCRQDVKDVVAEYEKGVQDFAGTRRSTLERQLAENRASPLWRKY